LASKGIDIHGSETSSISTSTYYQQVSVGNNSHECRVLLSATKNHSFSIYTGRMNSRDSQRANWHQSILHTIHQTSRTIFISIQHEVMVKFKLLCIISMGFWTSSKIHNVWSNEEI